MKKLLRVSTVPMSLDTFCEGQLKMLSQHFEVVAVSSDAPELQRIHEREGVRVVAVNMERHISLFRDLRALVRMICVIHRERPYIVHSMTPKAGLLSMVAAWVNRVPVRMHTYTGLVFPTATGLKQRVLIATDRLLCHCATYINPEGRGVAHDLQHYHITRKPLHIIANGNVRGVPLDYYRRSAEVMKQAEPLRLSACFTFCFVGRLVGDKGINELVEAFQRLHADLPQTRLLLVGRFEQALDPVSTATAQAIAKHPAIESVGERADVRPYYAAADALVFPSYREGFPNVVLEAGAMELPCIVTDINGSNEIISEGFNGTVVPPRNADALYQAMRRFATQPDACREMGQRGRKRVVERFDQRLIWAELLKVYQQF